MGDFNYKVGLSVVVVPDGFELVNKQWCCRLSLALAPDVGDSAAKIVDLRYWPRDVAAVLKGFAVAVSGNHLNPPANYSTYPCPLPSDVKMKPYAAEATRLWCRIFRDGSGDDDAGFRSLKTSLRDTLVDGKKQDIDCDCEKGGADSNQQHALISSPTVELARALDGITGSAIATAFVQRLAKHALHAGGHDVRQFAGLLHEASTPGAGWWRMLKDSWFGSGGVLSEARVQDSISNNTNAVAFHESAFLPATEPGGSGASARLAIYRQQKKAVAAHDGRDFFSRHIGDLHFWKTGRSSHRYLSDDRARSKFVEAYSQHRRVFNVADSGKDTRPLSDPECRKQAAARKYAGILAYPTLAKYLGLIVDIKIPAEFLLHGSNHARTSGAISVAPLTDDSDAPAAFQKTLSELIWTAYLIRRSADCENYEYFGPCEKEDSESVLSSVENPSTPPSDRLFSDGILNLGVTLPGDGKKRFALHTLDVTNLVTNLSCVADTADQKQELPELRTRGITLADCSTQDDRDKHDVSPLPPDPNPSSTSASPGIPRVMYTRDLITGYCVDVALATRNGKWQTKDRWTTLTARTLGYGSDVPANFLKHPEVGFVRERDDGYVRPLPRQASDCKVINSDLFAWTGESLAIPHMSDALEACKPCENATTRLELYPDPCSDLAIDLTYDLPRGSRADLRYRKPCPLREARKYVVGIRLRLINGCVVPFGQAVSRYISHQESLVIGDADGGAYKFLRRNSIHAPEVELPWNEQLVTAKDIKDANGDSIRELVVRTGVVNTPRSRRFLTPPRVTFDLAEQYGSFDSDNTPSPAGAFTGKVRIQLDRELGIFPSAYGGHWSFPKKAKQPLCGSKGKPAAAPKRVEIRGPVLILDCAAKPSATKFYPDPLARSLCARFQERETGLGHFGKMKGPMEFWPKDSSSNHAAPILLELKKGNPRSEDSDRGWFDDADNSVEITPLNSGKPLSLRKLSVVLAPGESVNLEIFSLPDPEEVLQRHHCAGQAIKLLRNRYRSGEIPTAESLGLPMNAAYHFQLLTYSLLHGNEKERLALFSKLLEQCALPPLMTKELVTLTHAVDKPGVPQFAWQDDKVGEEVRIYPVVLSVKGADVTEISEVAPQNPAAAGTKSRNGESVGSAQPGEMTWEEYVDQQECLNDDRRGWPSAEGGAKTFFVGEVKVDRKTTGRVRCDAEWKEYGPEIVHHDPKAGYVRAIPTHRAQLFSFGDIALVDPLLGDKLDLLRNDNTRLLRALSHSFVNGRARHLQLRVIATSRFTQYFPRETTQEVKSRETTGVGKYERGSTDLARSAARVWVPCTFRPFAPEIDKILPVFRWTTEVHESAVQIRWKRESSLRIFLGPNWYSSGEGEKLGIVCWPENLLNSNPIKEADSASKISRMKTPALDSDKILHRYGRFVTRWGADPVQLSGPVDDFISADRFVGILPEQKVSETLYKQAPQLFLPETELSQSATNLEPKKAEGINVCLLTYDPVLDSRDGTWSTDLTIDPGATYFPFVQLGLVRYQAHSVQGLELSYPTATTLQIPPTREGKIEFLNSREFLFELSGIGYRQTSPEPPSGSSPSQSDFPFLKLKLLRTYDSGTTPNARVNWQPVLDRSGHPVEFCDLRPRQRGAEVVWTQRISLPTDRCRIRFGLFMEEYEMRAWDVVDTKPNPKDFNDISFKTKLKPRGPMFSHIVDLGAPA